MILFNTANLVGRVSGYRFSLAEWGEQERRTIAATDEMEFARICRAIRDAGYVGVELWVAHCHPSAVTVSQAERRRRIAFDHGLRIVALAGAYTAANLRIAEALGVESINGGLWGTDLASVLTLMSRSSVAYNYENHPERTPEEILARIEAGSSRIGVALDTGWLGTSAAMEPVAFVRGLGSRIRHVHVKDVAARSSHRTVPLGTGVVGIPAVLEALRQVGFRGHLSWEDEPEDRNPLDIAAEMRLYLERHAPWALHTPEAAEKPTASAASRASS